MKPWSVFFVALFLSLLSTAGAAASGREPSQDEMRAEVAKLVSAAEKLTTLWPWSGPVPEVAQVAAYGKSIAPFLVNILADDPDALEESSRMSSPEVNWNVQQQVALALCKIYGVTEEGGHVYMNRASREENANVKRFWLRKVYQQ
jgi:hypothetical protein